MKTRQQSSHDVRVAAADLAHARPHPVHLSNGDERRFRRQDTSNGKRVDAPSYIGNFTKCLPHDENGFLKNPADYIAWLRAIDSGDEADIAAVPIGAGLTWAHDYPEGQEPEGVRAWESQGAGLTYDLEGPDAQAVSMPPAPTLESRELMAEMAEVYWMALCRDVPFAEWGTNPEIQQARKSLAQMAWFRDADEARLRAHSDKLTSSRDRRRVLIPAPNDPIDQIGLHQLFRGVGPGDTHGPYVSQFLLIGSGGVRDGDSIQAIEEGQIAYGAIRIDQRVRVATECDFMCSWEEWLDVQNGANVGRNASFAEKSDGFDGYRFISRPRDLATYVHFDALYEAYLNACLLLLGMGAPVDPGLPFTAPALVDKQDGFAQFGGPHILTLVTEVATRALKAVRFQKFNVHRRLRPEAVGGWLERLDKGPVFPASADALSAEELQARLKPLQPMLDCFKSSLVGLEEALNGSWLLPMAFPEGSPAHPSYGAGHATVAGACITLLKAWFDHGWQLRDGEGAPFAYEADTDGRCLVNRGGALGGEALTVEGELNKLAANISIGRNWAGVHYHSDYIESFRLGEQVALGLLEEQKLTYGENFSLTVPLLDGTTRRI